MMPAAARKPAAGPKPASATAKAHSASGHSPAPEGYGRLPAGAQGCACAGACPKCRSGPKPAVSVPGDPLEREADATAAAVMRLSAASGGDSPSVPAAKARTLPRGGDRGGGMPLAPALRRRIEPVLGTDLGRMRVHSDAEANRAAVRIRAKAFTQGNHVFLGPGQREGDLRLLAHEAAHVVQQGAGKAANVLQRQAESEDAGVPAGVPDAGTRDAGTPDADTLDAGTTPAGPAPTAVPRICGPDITSSLNTMLGTVEPWFRGLSGFQRNRSCAGLGPGGFLALVNPIMAWDTRELFLPNTGWLDAYYTRSSCGSPRDAGCPGDPTRRLCETAGSCGNSVIVDGKCMLAGTANYALFGKMCRLCHDYTGRWNRWDMRAVIGAWKTLDWDDSTPPKEVASAAYDGTFPTLPAAAENRGTCTGRCGAIHGGAFDFIWEPYRPR
ncbi:MAG TPA: DUF4157 domain-containing protein [Fibrobacteria bacterium]|nr:DUF4157 domain-containing protein [Fibrobacteria bacterium]